jgi:branched-subunit amino acid transport protein
VAAGAFTFATRASFIVLQGDREFPEGLRRALRYVPAAVLSAIVWPSVVAPGRELDLSPANLRIYAALVAALVAWRFKNILATIAAGMGVLWLLQGASGN